MMASDAIPKYNISAARSVDADFLFIENFAERSRIPNAKEILLEFRQVKKKKIEV
jgi:hypothetical protein